MEGKKGESLIEVLNDIRDGEVLRELEAEWQKVLWDIKNSNAPIDCVRELNMKIRCAPSPDGRSAIVSADIKTKLSAPDSVSQMVFMRSDGKKAELFAQDPAQLKLV